MLIINLMIRRYRSIHDSKNRFLLISQFDNMVITLTILVLPLILKEKGIINHTVNSMDTRYSNKRLLDFHDVF